MNPYEREGRAVKAGKLAAAFMRYCAEARIRNGDVVPAAKLAPPKFWEKLAGELRIRPPSEKTIALVVETLEVVTRRAAS